MFLNSCKTENNVLKTDMGFSLETLHVNISPTFRETMKRGGRTGQVRRGKERRISISSKNLY
jgi:hypothetical protein